MEYMLFMMVIVGLAGIELILLGVVDFCTALWTIKGLGDLKSSQPPSSTN